MYGAPRNAGACTCLLPDRGFRHTKAVYRSRLVRLKRIGRELGHFDLNRLEMHRLSWPDAMNIRAEQTTPRHRRIGGSSSTACDNAARYDRQASLRGKALRPCYRPGNEGRGILRRRLAGAAFAVRARAAVALSAELLITAKVLDPAVADWHSRWHTPPHGLAEASFPGHRSRIVVSRLGSFRSQDPS
jgi:hypothetical protein